MAGHRGELSRIHPGGVQTGRARSNDGADPFGVREDIELFHPDPNMRDARVGKANGADPFGETFAQIDMSGVCDFADRRRQFSRN